MAPRPLRAALRSRAPALLPVGRRACPSQRRAPPLAETAAERAHAEGWPRPLPPRPSARHARGLRQGARGCAELGGGARAARARERGRVCARGARGGGSGARRPRRVSGAGGRWARAAAPAAGASSAPSRLSRSRRVNNALECQR